MYCEGDKAKGVKRLPLNLLDALRALEKDKVLKGYLGDEVVAAFTKLKFDEWSDYCRHMTDWERRNPQDC